MPAWMPELMPGNVPVNRAWFRAPSRAPWTAPENPSVRGNSRLDAVAHPAGQEHRDGPRAFPLTPSQRLQLRA